MSNENEEPEVLGAIPGNNEHTDEPNGEASPGTSHLVLVEKQRSADAMVVGPMSVQGWRHAKEMADVLASSGMVPEAFQGRPGNVLIAMEYAHRMKLSPLQVMQGMVIIHKRPSWYAEFMIAVANSAGVFRERITWEIEGTETEPDVTAYAVLADGREVSEPLTWGDVVRRGWSKKDKYREMPVRMMQWRTASGLIRLHVPEVLAGLPPSCELEDIPPREPSLASLPPAVVTTTE